MREAIEARGASLIYLPPYSPDLNLIEQLFAKFKALIRKAVARTRETPGMPSDNSSAAWLRRNVPTTSPTPDMCYLSQNCSS